MPKHVGQLIDDRLKHIAAFDFLLSRTLGKVLLFIGRQARVIVNLASLFINQSLMGFVYLSENHRRILTIVKIRMVDFNFFKVGSTNLAFCSQM